MPVFWLRKPKKAIFIKVSDRIYMEILIDGFGGVDYRFSSGKE